MLLAAAIRQLDLSAEPEAVFAAMDRERPICAIWSEADDRRSRWTILAHPSGTLETGNHALRGVPNSVWPATAPDPPTPPNGELPFTGGWIGLLSYDLGGELEPHAPTSHHPQWPRAAWLRCEDALVYDRKELQWWSVGSPEVPDLAATRGATFTIGPVGGGTTRQRYCTAVRRSLDHIARGDIYQLNLTHELMAPFDGSTRAFFLALARRAKPWYGAYLELPGERAICSVSPELFLQIKPDGRIVTRPMKGTRTDAAPTAAAELRESDKERAELNMIVDLLRNDLGRVCAPGSIAVDQLRSIETHAPISMSSVSSAASSPATSALLQATATISGKLRPGVSLHEILRATFPGGSITGAPKIRAMRLIAELEARPRGPYCGSIGFISDSGHAAFNIAIRTALVHADRLSYAVGAGIVADSDPDAEWQETLDKARVLLDIAGQHALEQTTPVVTPAAHLAASPSTLGTR